MKKQIVSVCAAVASFVAVASTVESSNIFGVLKVDTGSTSMKEVMVCVPWIAVGTGSTNVKPTDLVATTGLSAGDELYYYDSSAKKYYGWTIADSAWTKVTTVENDKYEPDGTETSARGTGLIVKTAAQYIYLNGQYVSGTTALTISGKGDADMAVSYFAPTTQASVNLNSLSWTSGTPSYGDTIVVDGSTKYEYDGTNWGKVSYTSSTVTVDNVESTTYNKTINTSDATLAAGLAGWYVRKSTGNLTISL